MLVYVLCYLRYVLWIFEIHIYCDFQTGNSNSEPLFSLDCNCLCIFISVSSLSTSLPSDSRVLWPAPSTAQPLHHPLSHFSRFPTPIAVSPNAYCLCPRAYFAASLVVAPLFLPLVPLMGAVLITICSLTFHSAANTWPAASPIDWLSEGATESLTDCLLITLQSAEAR